MIVNVVFVHVGSHHILVTVLGHKGSKFLMCHLGHTAEGIHQKIVICFVGIHNILNRLF